jgi:2-keto-4-pentenoate hydratase
MTEHDIAAQLLAVHAGTKATRIEVADERQAYAVQALVAAKLGPIGGWKVGAPGPAAAPNCAPMPLAGLFKGPKDLDSKVFTQREVESEIGFTFKTGLPPRDTPYVADEIIAAIGTCQPGLEVLQSRLENPGAARALALLADFIQTGAYVWGEPIENWQSLDFTKMQVIQTISDGPGVTRIGNPAGDMVRLMLWLANTGTRWAGGIKAGHVVTCGSWTGKTQAPADCEVEAEFVGAQPVRLRFKP